jgi:malonyl-CoA/methylmalonyl-CoA synthetase
MSSQALELAMQDAWARHLDARIQRTALRATLSDSSLARAFAETAGTHGVRSALTIGGRTATHGELDRSAGAIGGWLASRDVNPGDRVLIAGGTSHELVAAYLGTLRCGATAMPVDHAVTAGELGRLLADAQPAAAFVAAGLAEALVSLPAEHRPGIVVGLEPGAAPIGIDEALTGAPIEPAGPKAPAILAYTSGTTGEPKGVSLTHANVLSSIRAAMLAWRWSPDDVMVHALPLSHQHGLGGLHATLLAGSHAAIEPRFEPRALCERIRGLAATVMLAVPAMYERLSVWEGIARARLDALRLAVSGSAPLSPRLAERVADWLGELPLERYGSTEAGLVLSNPLNGPRRPGRVGFPLPGIELRLVTDSGGDAGEGEEGEIMVRGPQVFEGYWRRPDATAEALDADGWFRSGDIGQLDPADGSFAITGRRSEMIISGGLNVFPGEVEAVLTDHDGVVGAAIAGVPSERWGEEVVAFVVPTPGGRIDSESLIAHCRERLSAYKCPKRVTAIDELPVNEMGKVRRDRLAVLAAGAGGGTTTDKEE